MNYILGADKPPKTIAEAKGLKPLAEIIFEQKDKTPLQELALPFINEEKKVPDVETALSGAGDIIAEMISDDAEMRKILRVFFQDTGIIVTTIKKDANPELAPTYSMYENYKESAQQMKLSMK